MFSLFYRPKTVAVSLNPSEHRLVRLALLDLRNRQIAAGRYTDAIDDILIKLRKVKFNSNRFCLGDLIPFDFS